MIYHTKDYFRLAFGSDLMSSKIMKIVNSCVCGVELITFDILIRINDEQK